MIEIEKAFGETTAVLFGKPLAGLGKHEPWLSLHVTWITKKKSCTSAKPVYVVAMPFFNALGANVVKFDEAFALASRMLGEKELESLSLKNCPELLAPIDTTTPEMVWEKDTGSEECGCYGNTQYCYRSAFCWLSKFTAYSYYTRECDHIFGSSNIFYCNFCINIYNSTNLNRCFEVSDSNKCTDCYYCHNCENLENSMFCFNAKGMRYAVGNIEVGQAEFTRLKKMLQAHLLKEIEAKHAVSLDILTIGSAALRKSSKGAKK